MSPRPRRFRAERSTRPGNTAGPAPEPSRDRFRKADRYRAEREWARYAGTAQRRLWRELRERFLARHTSPAHRVVDVGSGPGRFTGSLGGAGARRIALDASREMLRLLEERWREAPGQEATPDRVLGDASRPPLRPGSFDVVVALGNTLGFAGEEADRVWNATADLVAPGGRLIVEIAPGPGERSRYLARLPATQVGRLFRAPVAALLPRVDREGFAPSPARRSQPGDFRRLGPTDVEARVRERGWALRESMAVAPALGPEGARAEATARDPVAWEHLLALEEEVGRRADRQRLAAAVLMAAARPSNRDS